MVTPGIYKGIERRDWELGFGMCINFDIKFLNIWKTNNYKIKKSEIKIGLVKFQFAFLFLVWIFYLIIFQIEVEVLITFLYVGVDLLYHTLTIINKFFIKQCKIIQVLLNFSLFLVIILRRLYQKAIILEIEWFRLVAFICASKSKLLVLVLVEDISKLDVVLVIEIIVFIWLEGLFNVFLFEPFFCCFWLIISNLIPSIFPLCNLRPIHFFNLHQFLFFQLLTPLRRLHLRVSWRRLLSLMMKILVLHTFIFLPTPILLRSVWFNLSLKRKLWLSIQTIRSLKRLLKRCINPSPRHLSLTCRTIKRASQIRDHRLINFKLV